MNRPANLVDATAIIARLTDENTRLRAAISWVEAPFVDADTDRAEMAARIRMLLDDAGRASEPRHISATVEPLAWQWRSIGSWHTVSKEDVFDPEGYARRMAEASIGRYRPIYSAQAVARSAAPTERASATPAGGGGGTPAGRDGGGVSGATVASTPSPSASRPPLPLPGGEEMRSAAVDDFCAHIGWSPDTEITVWPLYWGGYVTYRLGDLVEAVPDTIGTLRDRRPLGALDGLMDRADFNRAPPPLAGAFTAMADRPFRAVFHPRNAIGDARS